MLLCLLLSLLLHCNLYSQKQTSNLIVTFTSSSQAGRENRDSVLLALSRLGITQYDTLDRYTAKSRPLDFTPWWCVIWCSGDPEIPFDTSQTVGEAAVSISEAEALVHFLNAGRLDSKKCLIMAGERIAHEAVFPSNPRAICSMFMIEGMHVLPTGYFSDTIPKMMVGGYSDYWSFSDRITARAPDIITVATQTPQVGPRVNGYAYHFNARPIDINDSGAGVTYYDTAITTVFYSVDWRDIKESSPSEAGQLTSGTTRVLRGALDFIASHGPIPRFSLVNNSSTAQNNSLEVESVMQNAGRIAVQFAVPQACSVEIDVDDILGRRLSSFTQSHLERGTHTCAIPRPTTSKQICILTVKATDDRGNIRSLCRRYVFTPR